MRRVFLCPPACLLLAAALLAGCSSTPPPATSAASRSAVYSRLSPEQASDIAIHALGLVGTPYRYGGNTPEGGFDCSGLVHYVYGQVAAGAARLPRSTAQWAAATTPVSEAALQRGDLVFFNTTGTPFSHMGIYVGGDQFVHAPSTGGTVRRDRLDNRYFAPRYLGARSVFAV